VKKNVKIGTYSIPDNPNRLPRLVEHTKKIYDTHEGRSIPNVNKNDSLAQLLGYKSSNNGAYWTELASLRAYGLLEGRSELKVSDLGKQITYGTGDQQSQAALKAVLNIPLWKQFYEKYRLQLPTTEFWAKLQSITNCEAPVARSNEQFITEAFRDDTSLIKNLKAVAPEVNDLTNSEQNPMDNRGENPNVQFIEVRAGPFYQRLPFNEQGKKIAMSFLEALDIETKKKGDKQPS
jgi:hypothetical protein